MSKIVMTDRIISSGLISLSIIIAILLLSWAALSIKSMDNRTIYVTGASSQLVKSNRGVWRGQLKANDTTRAGAYQKLIADQQKVKAFLGDMDIKPEQLNLGNVNVSEIYKRTYQGTDMSTIVGYRLSQELSVTLDSVATISILNTRISELLTSNVDIEGYSPQYLYTKLDSLKVDALGKAIENAKQRAQSMAKATGSSVGSLRSASMGVFQITPPDSTDVSDYGMNDTSTINKKITAVVNVTFQLN